MRWSLTALTMLLVAIAGCPAPPPFELVAEPKTACNCGDVKLKWKVGVEANIVASPQTTPPTNLTVRENGEMTVSGACEDTVFTMSGPSGAKVSSSVSVIPAEGQTFLLTAPPDCSTDGTFNGWKEVVVPEDFDSDMRVTNVVNNSDRDLVVTHSGVTAVLPQGAFSSAFNGKGFVGEWKIEGELKTDGLVVMSFESCIPFARRNWTPGGATDVPPGTGDSTIYNDPATMSLQVSVNCN